jgi:glycosyltransferase involved in cell wall biosynthesis
MQRDIQFSIIIPTYNRGNRIKDTLTSALNQDYDNFEVIVVDDGSTDNTEVVIQSFHNPRLRYFKKKNEERAAARNFGADRATGDYVTFLDSDDILYTCFLKNANQTLKKNNYPSFIHLGYEIKNENGRILAKVNKLKSDSFQLLVHGNPLSCIGVVIKRIDFLQNKFNEDRGLILSEDWELWLRLIANHGIKVDNRISAAMISHDTRSVLNSDEEKLLARKNLSFKYAFENERVKIIFGRYLKKMESYFDIYISLHLVLARKKVRSFHYLRKAFMENPFLILDRRFYAIVKHLIF